MAARRRRRSSPRPRRRNRARSIMRRIGRRARRGYRKAKGVVGMLGGDSHIGGTSLWEVAAVGTLGTVAVGALLKKSLPAWMPPLGIALWLYGWWTGNAILRTFGLLLIAIGFMNLLGIPKAVADGIQKIKKDGLGGLFKKTSGADGVDVDTSSPRGGGGGFNVDANKVSANIRDAAKIARAVNAASNA